MGIRFRCPQGHTLNVKSFLAGKKGVCPDCGARVRIPQESTINRDGSEIGKGAAKEPDDDDAHEIPPETPAMKSGEDLRDAAPIPQGTAPPLAQIPLAKVPAAALPVGQAAVPAGPVGTAVTGQAVPVTGQAVPVGGAAVRVAATAVAAMPVQGVARAVPVGGPGPAQAVVMGVAPAPAPPRPVVAAGGPLPPGLVDPISEAPNAVWYVRPTGGGQYGPARGDVFRQWIGQGRVAGDSLVWREGWGDWRAAGEVFPELASTSSAFGPGITGQTGGIVDGGAARSTANYLARKQSSTAVGIMLLVMLGIICLALMGVLIFVIPRLN